MQPALPFGGNYGDSMKTKKQKTFEPFSMAPTTIFFVYKIGGTFTLISRFEKRSGAQPCHTGDNLQSSALKKTGLNASYTLP